MSGLRVGAVKAALVDRISAALPGVQVSWAYLGESARDTSIWLGEARGQVVYQLMRTGRKPRTETTDVDVVIERRLSGGTQQQADTAVLDLSQTIEEMVADDPTLGVAGVQQAGVSAHSLVGGTLDVGHGARLTLTITYTARLT